MWRWASLSLMAHFKRTLDLPHAASVPMLTALGPCLTLRGPLKGFCFGLSLVKVYPILNLGISFGL